MIIYKVEINEVEADPLVCVSSYKNKRTTKHTEYYFKKDLAEARQKEIYDLMQKTLHFLPRIEAVITEVEVKGE